MSDDSSDTPPTQFPDRTGSHTPSGESDPQGASPPGASEVPTVSGDGSAATQTLPAITGYEVLEKLGEGAMGVVYKARDVKLNRAVALKLIQGDKAGPEARIRFMLEAEAVAAVSHPNVVQIHRSGDAEGQLFIALEYLTGGTLEDRLGKPLPLPAARELRQPLPPKAAARLLAEIARGIAAAHKQSIVHRDLKPANVMFDAGGIPKVTDFGLAKRGEGAGLSVPGWQPGTPAYMSPEQARGDPIVGAPADVWALGVMLYQAITHSRPFAGQSIPELLARIDDAKTVPPRELVPAIPPDLELICLHCLERQPHKRYPTATELADDLERFVRGEPISVRPAGPVERAVKWVKRNKVVSAAVAAVTVALLAGTAVSVAFALDARREADRATTAGNQLAETNETLTKTNDELAKSNHEVTVRERNTEAARNELAKVNDQLLGTLARSLIVPLNVDKDYQSLTPYEAAAFWELAASRGGPLGDCFLAEATRTPLASKQLAKRAAYTFQATLGLDADMYRRAEDLLAARIEAAATTDDQRAELALACVRLPVRSPGLTERSAQIIMAAMGKSDFRPRLDELSDALGAALARLEPARAAELLLVAIEQSPNRSAHGALARVLAGVAGRMEPAAAATAADRAGTLLARGTGDPDLGGEHDWAEGFAVLAARMSPDHAAGLLTKELGKQSNLYVWAKLAPGLAAAAARMEPGRGAELLVKAVEANREGSTRAALAQGLAVLIPRLPPAEAAAACGRVADLLIPGIEQSAAGLFNSYRLAEMAEGLAALAPGMDRTRAADLCNRAAVKVADALRTTKESLDERPLARALAALTARLDPKKAADLLNQAMTDFAAGTPLPSSDVMRELARGLVAASTRMEPIRAAEFLLNTMNRSRYFMIMPDLARGLGAAAERVGPNFAQALVIQIIPGSSDSRVVSVLSGTVVALAARMEPGEAAELLARAIATIKDPDALARFAVGLAAVTGRPERPLAIVTCNSAAARVVQAMDRAKDAYTLSNLADGLAALATRLPPARAAEVSERAEASLTRTMGTTTDPYKLGALAKAVAAVAVHLEPDKARAARGKAARMVMKLMENETRGDELCRLAEALIAVREGVDADTANVLLGAMRALPSLYERWVPAKYDLLGDTTPLAGPDQLTLAATLSPILFGSRHGERIAAAGAGALAIGTPLQPHGLFCGLPLLHQDFHPQPKPLPPQTLADLLKHPFCVGGARRAVLDALGYTYRREFADQWEFVRFVKENNLPLDLLTPPKRPQP